MMSLFVYDLSLRQREFLIESQSSQAISLAQNLSLISATPLLSSDFAGLQELTEAIADYPGVVHVMVVLPSGKIVAHGQPRLRGQFLADMNRFAGSAQAQQLTRSVALADAAQPVRVNDQTIGWVRVGVSQSATASKLAAITQSGLLYTLAAIAVGIVLAWMLGQRLTRRLQQLTGVAHAVRGGETQLRAPEQGHDELAVLAQAFNVMLDTLAHQNQQQQLLREALQLEKELAQVTLASIGDAVITTNARGEVQFLNAVAQAMTGRALSDVRDQPVEAVVPLADLSNRPTEHPVRQALRLGSSCNTVTAILDTAADLRIPVAYQASPILSDTGQTLGCVLVCRDVSEQQRAQERLQWQAGHDALTGLPNRVLLADRFERALEKSQRDGSQLAVCLLDLDHFKPVNDTLGHAVGDALLIALTERLTQALRGVDTLSRLGGDEFVLLLEDLRDQAALNELLHRILDCVARPFQLNGHTVKVTASLGLTVYPEDDADADTLLRHADQAMYVAKQTGRNRHHRFDVARDRAQASQHQTLERVRQAVVDGEFRLHYQPKVNLSRGSVDGFEALLRWQHPSDGMIPPLRFLPLVEQSDVVVDIGEWVIARALDQLTQWQALGVPWSISVNIAATHFQRDDFLPRLMILLAQWPQLAPGRLEFEILESAALVDLQAMRELIAQCRDLGIRFSLDDFGTGYSSLSYLKRLPVQMLKIDQSFVRDMLDDTDARALVQSIIHIASLFRLEVIAEGVETEDQGALLLRMGYERVQGFGIARPMPADQATAWALAYRADRHWQRLAQALPFSPTPAPAPVALPAPGPVPSEPPGI